MVQNKIPDRKEIPFEKTWNLESIFTSIEEWESAFGDIETALVGLNRYKNHLGDNPDTLLEWFGEHDEFTKKFMEIYTFAGLSYSVDTTNQGSVALYGRASGLMARVLAAISFAEPEIMAIGFDKLRTWMKDNREVEVYAHYIERLEKRVPHVRSIEVEELLGQVTDPFSTASQTHSVLANADLVFKPATDSNGYEHELSHSRIDEYKGSKDRELRRTAFENYADAHLANKHTMASCLSAGMKQDVFMSRARRFNSTLEASLAADFLSTEVYHNVIDTYRANLHVWHRYWEVRKRALGLDPFHVYDTRVTLSDQTPEVSYEQAVEWIVEGVQPLGSDYAEQVRRGATDLRWVDYMPNRGKRFGAFSAGSKGIQPFIMLSYDNTLWGLSILAHELGHSMHSILTWDNQPHIYCDYSLFVAEVASNFHQAIVRHHLLETHKERDFQIAITEEAMANFYRYFFIMPSLAIFDLEVHKRAERGEALTAEDLTNLAADIFSEGYGPNVEVDRERVGCTWMQFSTHLYDNYYTYQYTTGISGAHALAEGVLSGNEKARDNYLAFLKAGDSMYSLDALKLAGVDLTTPEPVEKTFEVLSQHIDRLEALL
ncbi:MAG: oligoendopeptidase F [Anaerolineaceae bacterium]|nr:oligoendopeptidase F [Anaerolineaceae bacterium]